MAAESMSTGDANGNRNPTQSKEGHHTLSCTHCRQRKVKCDKIHPCSHCQKSNLTCVFPERVKNAKKRKNGTKTSNDELMRRLKRMEELIGKIEGGGGDTHDGSTPNPNADGEDVGSPEIKAESPSRTPFPPKQIDDQPEDRLNRYMGNTLFRSLTAEVEGLKQSMDDLTDDEEMSSLSAKSPPDLQTPGSSAVFASTLSAPRDLRLLHPSPIHISMLCNLYIQNVDPMFKVLYVPALRNMVSDAVACLDNVVSGSHDEALLFAMYYGAITSLTKEECLQNFHDGKDSLLAKYRAGVERALSNANFLTECDLETLQALAIFLIAVRANDSSQFSWTMFGLAVRLAHGLGLHREGSTPGLTPFQQEMRRRVWWGLISLDIRCAEDVATDPVIGELTFNTKKPLKINDGDMDPKSMQPIVERGGFTEVTKSRLSHDVARLLWQIGFRPPTKEGEEPYVMPVEEKMKIMRESEQHIQENFIAIADTSNPVGWAAMVVAQIIQRRLRLAIYHPLQYGSKPSDRPEVSRDTLLKTAVETLELANMLDTDPIGARFRWYFKTYVQWHALAATLAELCIQTKGPFVERAWRIVDLVFEDWAERIADSPNGMLWRPIKKLKSKAESVRKAFQTKSTIQQPLPDFGIPAITQPQQPSEIHIKMDTASTPLPQDMILDPPAILEGDLQPDGMAALNMNESVGSINWAEWDEFMHDYQQDVQYANQKAKTPLVEKKLPDAWVPESWW